MNWYVEVLKKYAEFTGRARRTEYWMFVLINFIISVVLMTVDVLLGTPFNVIYGLAIIIPGIAVGVRRLHDIGKSGWMLLIAIIPLIGFIWLIVLFATSGDYGDNQYGSDPKGGIPEQI